MQINLPLDFSAATGIFFFYFFGGYSQFNWAVAVLNFTVYSGEQMMLPLSAAASFTSSQSENKRTAEDSIKLGISPWSLFLQWYKSTK